MANLIKGVNDLATLYPELIKEWDYTKNKIIPEEVTAHSNRKAFWICQTCKGEWESIIGSRTKGHGCPYCSGNKVLKGYNDLKTLFPNIVKEWNYAKNTISPEEITAHTNRKAHWICNVCKGEWEATIASRVDGHGCPYCAGKRVLQGKTDLKTLFPQIAAEWDYERNGSQIPEQTAPNSMKKIHWICKECGNKWVATVNNRTHKHSGCPECAKNYHASFPEKAVFYYLSMLFEDTVENAVLDCLKNKELDIYIPSINTAVEYDGEVWHKSASRDIEKDKLCKKNGLTLIRIREPDCPKLEAPNSIIIQLATETRTELNLAIKRILDFLLPNNNIVVDTENDSLKIYELMKVPTIYNSLDSMNPEIASEWHPTKNGTLQPQDFKNGSNKKVWWKCKKCGYEWKTSISARTRKGIRTGSNCPCCTGRIVVKGINDLETLCPDLASEWNYKKNYGLKNQSGLNISTPDRVTARSSQRVWWKCSHCGYEWASSISNRSRNNSKCPKCHYK